MIDAADFLKWLLVFDVPNGGSTPGFVNSVSGTANEIDVDNTDPSNPIISLSSTIDTPGTFNIQSTTAIDAIINDSAMSTASATNISTALAMKIYVDQTAQGRKFKDPVITASTANFASTYDNGISGVGATLTATSNGAFLQDGETGVLNGRYLQKDQTNTFENGIYTITQVGDGSNPAILTRSTGMDAPSEFEYATTFTLEGSVNQGKFYTETNVVTTVGTDAVTFVVTGDATTGIVNTGSENQIAFYAANGDAVSGTDTIPTTVQSNITRLGTQVQALNMGSRRIFNVADPIADQDAANKVYVNNRSTLRLPSYNEIGDDLDATNEALGVYFSQKPWSSTTLYTTGPTHGAGANAFIGNVNLPDGRVCLVPFASANIGLFDPSDNTYTNGPAHGEGSNAFIGGVLLSNGTVCFVPFLSGAVGLFNPSTNAYTSGATHGTGTNAFQGGVLLPDGRVCFVPFNSSNIGLYTPSTNTYTNGPAHGEGSTAFIGGSILPDGRVCLVPFASANVGLFDPSTNTYTTGPAHGEGSTAFQGSTLLPDGRVCLIPFNSSNIGLFDPSDNSYTSGPPRGAGVNSFSGGTLLPDGRVCMVPYNYTNVGLYDPITNTYADGPAHGAGGSTLFSGSVRLQDGRVCFTPRSSATVGLLNAYSVTPDSRNVCMHPFFNKL